jgi:hypothetical protein
MGVMRFRIPSGAGDASAPEYERACLGGIDGRVFAMQVSVEDDLLVCRRESSESARLHIPWPMPGYGRPVLSTASLRERDAPYHLSVELARGRLGSLRDQVASWQIAGMVVPDEAAAALADAHSAFAEAACAQEDADRAAAAASVSLSSSCRAADALVSAYVRQRLTARRRRSSHLPVLLSCPLGLLRPGGAWEKLFVTAFTATSVAMEWRNVELRQGDYEWTLPDEQASFAERNRLVIAAGPLLDFSPGGLPEWLWQWSHDYYGLQCFVSDYVETAVSRYAGRIRLWEIAARANTGGAISLDEEHRLALTARAVEVARQIDDELQLSLRVDQPWGEYQAEGRHRLSPLQFVDALVRSGVGLASITLEIAVGARPGGSDYRDRFEISRLLDLWSALGLPLTVCLAFPSQGRRDPAAAEGIEVAPPQSPAPWGEPAQAEWLAGVMPVLMAKAAVVGIEWTHFSDALPHRFPHAGLVSADGAAKPALERLTRLRQSYWRGECEDA